VWNKKILEKVNVGVTSVICGLLGKHGNTFPINWVFTWGLSSHIGIYWLRLRTLKNTSMLTRVEEKDHIYLFNITYILFRITVERWWIWILSMSTTGNWEVMNMNVILAHHGQLGAQEITIFILWEDDK